MKVRYLIGPIAGAVLAIAASLVYGNYEWNLHKSWSRGYTECMTDVINALARHDEVRIGNLVVNEPNTHVSDITFFGIDPNVFIEVAVPNVTISGGKFNAMTDGYEYPESEVSAGTISEPNDSNGIDIEEQIEKN